MHHDYDDANLPANSGDKYDIHDAYVITIHTDTRDCQVTTVLVLGLLRCLFNDMIKSPKPDGCTNAGHEQPLRKRSGSAGADELSV